jgi:hypothetical protein
MTAISKIDAVKLALNNDELRNWYATEHNLTVESFTTANVNQYGMGGLGDMADQIISDAIEHNIINQD